MNKTVQERYGRQGMDETTFAFDLTQKELKCCGVSGPSDWQTSNWRQGSGKPVPQSCCVFKGNVPLNESLCYDAANNPTMPDAATYIHQQGCQEQLQNWVEEHALLLAGVAIGLAVIQMFSVCLACCLRKSVQSEYQYV